jgi:hypothetical protein
MSEKELLVAKINNSCWWRVPPADSDAYKKRGKFFASTFSQAEFYGRPNDEPERVNIGNPVYGFSEMEILEKLFTSEQIRKLGFKDIENGSGPNWYKKRIALDRKMYLRAKKLGYDALVLMTPQGKKDLQRNRKPRSIELNL